METRDEYVKRKKRQLDSWSADMDLAEANASKAKENVRAKYHEQLAALRIKRQESEKKIAAIMGATDDSWAHLKAETENVWISFKNSLHQFKLHFDLNKN